MAKVQIPRKQVYAAAALLIVLVLFIAWRSNSQIKPPKKNEAFESRYHPDNNKGMKENQPFFNFQLTKNDDVILEEVKGEIPDSTRNVQTKNDVIDEEVKGEIPDSTRNVQTKNDEEVKGDTHDVMDENVKGEIPIKNDVIYKESPAKNDDVMIINEEVKGEIPESITDSVQTPITYTSPPPLPTFYPSKHLFVRAVYFDRRHRGGHHNTSVFLVVSWKNITDNNLIVGCQVDNKPAVHFDVKLIGETPLFRAFYPKINHEEVLVHCYDLPARNGSMGYIMYKKRPDSDVIFAASERPLFVPPPRIDPVSYEGRKYNMTIVTCAKIFGNPPWLQKWLTYQKTLGVDHVHFDAEDSFVPKGSLKVFLDDLLRKGFLSIDTWKKYLNSGELWYHNQGLIYEDCPYRFQGTYDYIVMVDTDDFFTPRVTKEKHIHYYINRFCKGKKIGSCKFKWVEYFPDTFGLNSNISTEDGNVTRSLKDYTHYNQGNPKSLHRTTVLIDTATHYASIMMPGYKIANVPVTEAYVAHVRLNNVIDGKNVIANVP